MAAFLLLSGCVFAQKNVAKWTRFETTLNSGKAYQYALHDVAVAVEFTAPSGKVHRVDAFWDGELLWKARISPDEIGTWKWRSTASDTANAGLHSVSGEFECVPYTGSNPLYVHGPIRASRNGHYLEHADGTPFFWLSDTVWAGALLSDDYGWQYYLKDRVGKRFTALQFMGTQNIAAAADAQGRQAFGGREKIVIDPYFFRRMDRRVNAINEAGMVASPTFSWAAEWHPSAKLLDPGAFLGDEELIRFCKYFIARYGAHSVIWMLGGDHDYRPPQIAERWRKIGRAVFGDKPSQLVTFHPAPRMLLKKEFGTEPWVGFLGYQSSHAMDEQTITWIVKGEPAVEWKQEPVKPVINIEPQYEAHMNFAAKRLATPLDVRQATWWSLLVSPTAGTSYGGHGVWSWETQPAVPMNHYATGVAKPWSDAVHLPGSMQMKHIRTILDNVEWWKLVPAPDLLASQPGDRRVQDFIAAAKTEDGRSAMIYTPVAQPISVRGFKFTEAAWHDPADGSSRRAEGTTTFTPPAKNADGDGDWVLVLKVK